MLLQQEVVSVKDEQTENHSRGRKIKKGSFRAASTWSSILSGLFVVFLSVGLLGLSSLRKSLTSSLASAVQSFNWMVLVEGDSLQNDEVGRYLKQLPGAKEVTFVSSQEAFAKLQADPLYFNDLSSFKPEDLPASWRVSWDGDSLDFSLLDLWAEDVKHLPSVTNLAFDPHAVSLIKGLRSAWYAVRLTLAALVLSGLIFVMVLLGRLLFFTSLNGAQFQKIGSTLLIDGLLWAAAGLAIYKLVGPFEWPLWAGGLVIGFIHFIWKVLEKRT